jgi:hypothetical protein
MDDNPGLQFEYRKYSVRHSECEVPHKLSLWKGLSIRMEILRESMPFIIGLVLPPVLMLILHGLRLSKYKRAAAFVAAIVIGFCVSLLVGELATGLPDGLMAIIIDSSLVYMGSQLTYHLLWKPLFALQFQPRANVSYLKEKRK